CQTTSGTELKVTGRGYWNPIWRKAHRAIVRAGLVQAIGRGRGILKNGCDVVVLSTEECGLQVVDDSVPYFPDHLWDFYDQLTNLDAKNPINTLYRNVAHNTSEYAKRTGLPERTVQFKLKQLEELG
ncbi:MAG TPA: hypothetical protein DD473_04995, partial [Planctomycetaceae bacterium]|nr:hypothetical protein [Planctomycetaceae bacterium]